MSDKLASGEVVSLGTLGLRLDRNGAFARLQRCGQSGGETRCAGFGRAELGCGRGRTWR
jgi:hypothetical protein